MTAINNNPLFSEAVACYLYELWSIVLKVKIKKSEKALKLTHMYTMLKACSFLLKTIPPQKNAHPRTNNMLDKIDPNKETWTTCVFPLFNAYIAVISSVAFPKVALKRPPTARSNGIS